MNTTDTPNPHDRFLAPFSSFVLTHDQHRASLKDLSIAFLVWSLNISGGTNVILEHALYLQRMGARVTLVHYATETVSNWHPALSALKVLRPSDIVDAEFDICVATWWRTALQLHEIRARAYIYLVQSIESRFFAQSSPRHVPVIEATYSLGIPIITISKWIQAYLAARHRAPSLLCRNGIDKTLFNLIGRTADGSARRRRLRALVEGPLGVDFKQTELALQALQPFRDRLEVWLLTSTQTIGHPHADRTISRAELAQVPAVMRSCDFLLKLSLVEGMFGPPLEMFHCGGTAITSRVTGCDEYLVHEHNALLIDNTSDPASLRNAIGRIVDDKALLNRLRENAVATASAWPSWASSSTEFASSLLLIHTNRGHFFPSSYNELRSQLARTDSGIQL